VNKFTIFALSLSLGCACSKSNVVNTTNNNTYNNSTMIVGASGARLESSSGATVDIPANALTVETELSISEVLPTEAGVPSLPEIDGLAQRLRSPIFALQPHGQVFAGEVTISLPHDVDTPNEPGVTPQVWRAEPNGSWQPIESLSNLTNRVIVVTRNFSYYAVFSEPPLDCKEECGAGTVCGCMDGSLPPCPAAVFPSCIACETSTLVQIEREAWQRLTEAEHEMARCTPGVTDCEEHFVTFKKIRPKMAERDYDPVACGLPQEGTTEWTCPEGYYCDQQNGGCYEGSNADNICMAVCQSPVAMGASPMNGGPAWTAWMNASAALPETCLPPVQSRHCRADPLGRPLDSLNRRPYVPDADAGFCPNPVTFRFETSPVECQQAPSGDYYCAYTEK